MRSRIELLFENLRREDRKALIPFITAGDPDFEVTGKLVTKLSASGADIIELGIPFSDPLADGPVIQRSALRALRSGTTLKKILHFVQEIRREVSLPLVLMSSYNPILAYGLEGFCVDAADAGVDGVIVPDLPPEEADALKKAADARGIDTIFLLAPTTGPERAKRISEMGRGFLYYVSLTGVTGSSALALNEVRDRISELRTITGKPLCVGFGISSPEEAGKTAEFADGVIVGSAIVKMVEAGGRDAGLMEEVGTFVRSLKDAL